MKKQSKNKHNGEYDPFVAFFYQILKHGDVTPARCEAILDKMFFTNAYAFDNKELLAMARKIVTYIDESGQDLRKRIKERLFVRTD